ncbi:hypothetical protein ABB22_09010 [Stenotrophomonas nitritireducens]|uniref:Uncharacterized protein n=1 Tax=Stenotrophomonas nitritireducens TaxID=83617 RepID=A0ABR5NJU2_9GAMM|nr:hypothetical protein ABB22_09010 [Stenotrophomonas nitritireducens]
MAADSVPASSSTAQAFVVEFLLPVMIVLLFCRGSRAAVSVDRGAPAVPMMGAVLLGPPQGRINDR